MKAGWLSSEFWLSLLAVIIPGLVSAFNGSGDPRLVVAGVAVSGLYSLGRSAVKVAGEVGAAKVAASQAFDPNVFGAMTAHEKAAVIAAASVSAPTQTNPLLSSAH